MCAADDALADIRELFFEVYLLDRRACKKLNFVAVLALPWHV